MFFKYYLIIFNFCYFAHSLEVQLTVQKNETTINYTVIDHSNSKKETFISEKLFFSKCECNFNNDVFYVSPKNNLINFTINTTESLSNDTNENNIEEHNLYINSKNIETKYSLDNINKNLYELKIHTMCKNKNKENYNITKLNKTVINKGIYKIESYSKNHHPEFNDNYDFAFLNFTFNYNKTLQYFSFVKICSYDSMWKEILSCGVVMLIAFIYIYLSTYMKLKFKIFKEIQKMAEIKWYHIILGVLGGSGMLILIYFYKNYIFIILNALIGIESWICAFYTVLFFILEISKKLFQNEKYKELNKKKYKLLFDSNIYEIISSIISGITILFYFITRHWILNNIICFCFSFTIMSIFILKSFILSFLFLFAYFIYDTFWVFYSEKIFNDNVMDVAATSIQIPIKIEMPILFSNNPVNNCMLLGLGDIILPGIVIKYCRRFDLIRQKNNLFNTASKEFSFYSYNLFLYFISVLIAMIMMFGFNHSQPVLFYISPIFIIGLMGKAYYNKCFLDFWKGLKLKKKNKNKDNINDKNNDIKEKIEDKKNEGENDKIIKEEKNEEGEEEEEEEEESEENDMKTKSEQKIKKD